jgi:fructoselysine 6-kinase
MTETQPTTVVFGPIMADRYVNTRLMYPGGGALNVAYHLQMRGLEPFLLSRVGNDAAGARLLAFLRAHGIAHDARCITTEGATSSIDITMQADRQPAMDNFIEGVWDGFRLSESEEHVASCAARLHTVMVGAVPAELERIGELGQLRDAFVSADFLSFRRYPIERFANALRHIDLAFIGWPGDANDETVRAIRTVAFKMAKIVVITMGERPTRVFDGRGTAAEHVVPVEALPVSGTTVGCGDAFIAAFLASCWSGGSLLHATAKGHAGGGSATLTEHALPDEAYEPHEPSPTTHHEPCR